MTTVIERLVGGAVPEEAPYPIFSTWQDWHDAMLFIDGSGATIDSGRAAYIRDTTKWGPLWPELGSSDTAAVDDNTYGRKVLTTVGVDDANAAGYGGRAAQLGLNFAAGFTWGLIYRRETGTTNGTLFSVRDGTNGNGLFIVQQILSGQRIRTVTRHRFAGDASLVNEAASPINPEQWNVFRGVVDWDNMAAAHRRIWPASGAEASGTIPTSGSAGAPDWSRYTVRALDKIYTAAQTGRFYGQLGAFIIMPGVLGGSELAAFDARLSALAAEIDS